MSSTHSQHQQQPEPLPLAVSQPPFLLGKSSWNDVIGSSGNVLERIDVNRIPSTVHFEEEGGVSSPNGTIFGGTGKRSEREANSGEDNEIERACSRGIRDNEYGENYKNKLRLSKDQSVILEESFKEHNTLNPNGRARTKLKHTEVDCKYLKRCCKNLTDDNIRLHKEVQVLRALKLSPQLWMELATIKMGKL